MHPRMLFTGILVVLSVALNIAFGIYVWVFEKLYRGIHSRQTDLQTITDFLDATTT